MVTRNQYLLVISILGGRKFPKRTSHQLVLESRFDGELLATDPVPHVEAPEFNSELAWEVSKKLLHQYRLQRTPIKLQCYAVDPHTSARENVGYILLDLRGAATQETTPAKVPTHTKWYTFLNTKYSRHKPELKVGLSLEDDEGAKDESFKAKSAPPRKGKAPSPESLSESELDPRTMVPILNNAEGFYQIGPSDRCQEKFVLSVTIAFANNLTQLVPSAIPLPHREGGFFFFYQLFGNDVPSDAFKDIFDPQFPAERASVHIRSSVEVLRMYFQKNPSLEIHFCCGDQTLGSSAIPLSQLLSPPSEAIDHQPVAVEGIFELISPAQRTSTSGPSEVPGVGASVILRREGIPLEPQKPKIPDPVEEKNPEKPVKHPPHSDEDLDVIPEKQSRPKSSTPKTSRQKDKKRPRERKDADTDEEAESLKDENEDVRQRTGVTRRDSDHQEVSKQNGPLPVSDPEGHQVKPPSQHPPLPAGGPAIHSTHMQSSGPIGHPHHFRMPQSLPDVASHFGFSIDLRSIKNMHTKSALNLYLRYSYPFFGSSAPILTHPPVEVYNKHMEVLLPHSFCAFDFATTHDQLQDTLNRVPLLVEIWHRDKLAKDELLGIARVPLSGVLAAQKVHMAGLQQGSAAIWRQICSERVVALTVGEDPSPVAELLIVLGLEDYGPINTRQVFMSSESEKEKPPPRSRVQEEPERDRPPDPRETQEYKAALELEMWKEQQVDVFESQMKEKELHHLKSLAEEFKRRDKERELLLKKKLDEYNTLAEQLRLALGDIEKREKQLSANEAEVIRLQSDLHREYERKLMEMQEASRRMKEDCIHQVELEKSKARLLEEEKRHLTDQLTRLQNQLTEKDQDFVTFKEHSSNKPEAKLQAEINMFTLEKVELERKVEAITKSKIHYKQQWGRALKELARHKQREQTEAKVRLQRQQQELEHMRLRYLAAEEKEVAKTEQQELQEIKTELSKLKEKEDNREPPTRSSNQNPEPHPHSSGGYPQGQHPNAGQAQDTHTDEHVTRLIEERDTLLRTGVYTHQDRIIVELDKQIREAIARQGDS